MSSGVNALQWLNGIHDSIFFHRMEAYTGVNPINSVQEMARKIFLHFQARLLVVQTQMQAIILESSGAGEENLKGR